MIPWMNMLNIKVVQIKWDGCYSVYLFFGEIIKDGSNSLVMQGFNLQMTCQNYIWPFGCKFSIDMSNSQPW
jgi:hypothetical protein